LDRIAQLTKRPTEALRTFPKFAFVITEPAARTHAFGVMAELRREGKIDTTMDLGGRSLKGQMKQADRSGASYAVIIGPDEWSRQVATIRDMREKEQEEIPLSKLPKALMEK
jgi:histidyl-tRNA synthetase